MKWFHDLAIATKLIVSFVTVLVLMALLGIMSIVRLADVNQTSTALATNWMPSIQTAGDIRAGLSRFRTLELQHVVSTEPTEMAGYEQQMNAVLAELNKDKQRYERLISSPEERKLYDELAALLAQFMTEHDKVIALSRELKTEEAVAATRGQANRHFEQLIQRIDAIVKLNREGGAKADAEGTTLYESSRLLIVIQLLVAIAVGLTLAIWQARTIARSLKEAAAVAQSVAAGDLTSTIEVRSKDETGQLMAALKAMNDSLVGIVSEVRSGTDTIATASGQIASGNLDLSSRTEEQASSLEETASSMEELTSTVKQNADNARQANGLVQSAATVAARGGEVVAQVVDTMGAINESSRKIVDIISVIDGIAFQTNILALNAAVEAARAGEQGRGFAVVAGEVRTLAQRSANAAKEIKALIDDSVGKVDTGARLVNDAGATMKSIMDSVNSVATIMGEISMASQEQTSGIDQINQAIAQMDQVTQQNAALVEEAAAASEAMQEQAGKLSDAVAVFKLNGRHEAKAAPVHGQAARIDPVAKPAAKVALKPAVKPAVTRSAPQLARAAAVKEDEWEQF